jgi:hypothetical protein
MTNNCLLLMAQLLDLMLYNQHIAQHMKNIRSSFYMKPLIKEIKLHKHADLQQTLLNFIFTGFLQASHEILDIHHGIASVCVCYSCILRAIQLKLRVAQFFRISPPFMKPECLSLYLQQPVTARSQIHPNPHPHILCLEGTF